jgi:outer membrane protein assembly factor BamB
MKPNLTPLKLAACSLLSLCTLNALAEEWPEWRGPRNDGIVRDEKIADAWPAEGPAKLWEAQVGIGFSSPVAVDGVVYLFAIEDGKDTAYAFDAGTGQVRWKQQSDSFYTGEMNQAAMAKDWTGTRASPTIDGDRVYTYGFRGDLICRERATGKQIWHNNVVTETRTKPITWGQGSNPLIDGDTIYVQGGINGPVLLALDKNTGKILWQSENLPEDTSKDDPEDYGKGEFDKGGYARPILVDVKGTKQLIVFGGEALWAFDPRNGKTLWSHAWPTQYDVNAATPIHHEGKLFITSAYGKPPARCALFELTPTGVKEVWKNNQLTAKYQPPILENGHLYGNSEGAVRCLSWKDGKTLWTAKDRISQGGSMVRVAPDKLLMFTETGKALLARATPEKYEKLGEFQAVERTGNAWSTPLVYRGKMYVKGRNDFICYDLANARSASADAK